MVLLKITRKENKKMENKNKSIRVSEDTYKDLRDIQHSKRLNTLTQTLDFLVKENQNDMDNNLIEVINQLRAKKIKEVNSKMQNLLNIINKANHELSYDSFIKLCSKEDLERIANTTTIEDTEKTILEIWERMDKGE